MRFGIIGNLEKPGLADAVSRLMKALDTHGVGYIVDTQVAGLMKIKTDHCGSVQECATKSDIIVAFGGDGTILSAARLVGERETPILGVNLGKLGFLAEIAPDEIEVAIAEIIEKKYNIEQRLVLKGECTGIPGRVFYAINDIVIDKSRSSRAIDLETYINGVFAVTYRADGLIVSTPTGSTAYALSSGGPIVVPTSAVMGITPISPHTLSGRPLILPQESSIRVVVDGVVEEVLVSADGHTEGMLPPPVEVHITKAPYRLKLVKRIDRSYFDVLRAKLLWGRDARIAS